MQFVVGYPGSGTTWIRAVLASYALDVGPQDFITVYSENSTLSKHLWSDLNLHHYQSSTPLTLKDLNLPNQVRLRPAAMMLLSRDVSRAPERDLVLIHSHHAHCSINGIHLWNGQWTDRVLNPVRDPREICCSLSARFGISYEETADYMADQEAQYPPEGGLPESGNEEAGSLSSNAEDKTGEDSNKDAHLHHLLLSWSKHIRSWSQPDHIDVLSVRYEDLCEDAVTAFGGILAFLGIDDPDQERVEEAIETVRFDRMQEAEEEYGLPAIADGEGHFFRSGQADGWKNELPTSVARRIEEEHGEAMAALGYL